jgi:hypothetical protein
MRPLGKQPKRIDVFSVPDHHRDGERVFLVPQLCEAAIRERLHKLESAKRIHSMAQEQDDPTLMIGAYNFLAGTLYYLGDMGTAHQYVMRGVQLWRSGSVHSHAGAGELESGAVVCLGLAAICEWHLGRIASCQGLVDEAISLAKELNDMSALALALQCRQVRHRY